MPPSALRYETRRVCVWHSAGIIVLTLGIVSMDRASEEEEERKKVAGLMEGCEVWIQEIGIAFTQCRGKSGSTVRGENCL